MPANELLLRSREAILGIVGVRNGFRDRSHGRQRVDRSQGTGELERRKGVIVSRGWIWFRNYLRREEVGEEITLLVNSLVLGLYLRASVTYPVNQSAQGTYPAPFETVLRAEEAIGAHLQTCRALQIASVVLASQSDTFPSRSCRSHIEIQNTRATKKTQVSTQNHDRCRRESCEGQKSDSPRRTKPSYALAQYG